RRTVGRHAVATERRPASDARTDAGAPPTANLSGAQFATKGPDKLETVANNCRGCALGRSYEPGSFRPSGGQDREPQSATDRDVPVGIRAALDRTVSCHLGRPR